VEAKAEVEAKSGSGSGSRRSAHHTKMKVENNVWESQKGV